MTPGPSEPMSGASIVQSSGVLVVVASLAMAAALL